MPKPKTTTPPDLDALYSAALGQVGRPVEIETPQLGRVSWPRPAELYTALNLLRMEQARAAGVAMTGVITIKYSDGLGPSRS
jgi:hypothetical protein